MSAFDYGAGYANTLGALIGTFTRECVTADAMSKDLAMARTIEAFNAGNFDLISQVSLIGMDTPLETRINVPKAIVMDLKPLIISEAVMETSMSVSSSEVSELSSDTEAEAEGEGSANYGLFKVRVRVRAKTSVHSSNKRTSDKRASCDTKLTMIQGEAPEGAMRLLDALLISVDKGMEINEKIIESKAQKLAQQADSYIDDGYSDDDYSDDDYSEDSSEDDYSDDSSEDDYSDDSSEDDFSDDSESSEEPVE